MSITRAVTRRQQKAADLEALQEARAKPEGDRVADDHHYLNLHWIRRHKSTTRTYPVRVQ